MPNAVDLSGKRFGSLVAVEFAGHLGKSRAWRCRCDCGGEIVVRAGGLTTGNTKSCGCRITRVLRERNTSHGQSKTPEYNVWCLMNRRCHKPDSPRYKDYGGRGIHVCDRWRHSFENFIADMGPRPSDKHELDRIDNNAGYSPDNSRWATPLVNIRNSRKVPKLTAWGESKGVCEWAADPRCVVALSTIHRRLGLGWSLELALATPARVGQKVLTISGRQRKT